MVNGAGHSLRSNNTILIFNLFEVNDMSDDQSAKREKSFIERLFGSKDNETKQAQTEEENSRMADRFFCHRNSFTCRYLDDLRYYFAFGISNINKEPPDWVALSDIYAFGVQYPVLGMVSRYAWYSAIASGV